MKNALIGFSSGLICGLLGAGGGLILVPAFIFIDKMDEKVARATSIFCILPLVAISCAFYIKNQYIDWNIGIRCAIGGIMGSIIGSILLGLAVMEIPVLSLFLKTHSIPMLHLEILFLLGAVIFIVMELYKLFRYHLKNNK